jgi:uncharacterized protein
VLYRTAAKWKPIPGADAPKAEKDAWNHVRFNPLKTPAIRIEAELQPGFSGGVIEWSVE